MSFKRFGLFLLGLCIAILNQACTSQNNDDGSAVLFDTMESTVLNMEMNYSVYLPPSYSEKGPADYPVLYLLHGYYGTYKDWPANGMQDIVDEVIKNGESDEIIVIMPDGLDSFYVNDFDNRNLAYEDFFVTEFIPYIESKYPVSNEKNNRGIAGLSMGGYGASYYAFKYHNRYSFAYSLSGAVGIGGTAPELTSIVSDKSRNEIAELPTYFMDCGTNDYLLGDNEAFSEFLTEQEIPHTFTTRLGAHDWVFWTSGLPDVIKKFYLVRMNN